MSNFEVRMKLEFSNLQAKSLTYSTLHAYDDLNTQNKEYNERISSIFQILVDSIVTVNTTAYHRYLI